MTSRDKITPDKHDTRQRQRQGETEAGQAQCWTSFNSNCCSLVGVLMDDTCQGPKAVLCHVLQDKTRQDIPRQAMTRERPRQDKTRQSKTRQDKTRHCLCSRGRSRSLSPVSVLLTFHPRASWYKRKNNALDNDKRKNWQDHDMVRPRQDQDKTKTRPRQDQDKTKTRPRQDQDKTRQRKTKQGKARQDKTWC